MKKRLLIVSALAAIVLAGPVLLAQSGQRGSPSNNVREPAAAPAAPDADHLLDLLDDYQLDLSSAQCEPAAASRVIFDEAFFDRCIAVARRLSPDFGDQLAELRRTDPKKFEHNLRVHGRTLVSLAQLAEIHPNLFELRLGLMQIDQMTNDVAGEFRRVLATPQREQIALLEPKLRAHIKVQVELSFKVREEQLCQLRDHVQRLESELEADQKRSEQIVEERFLGILGRQALANYRSYKASTSPQAAESIHRFMEQEAKRNKTDYPPE